MDDGHLQMRELVLLAIQVYPRGKDRRPKDSDCKEESKHEFDQHREMVPFGRRVCARPSLYRLKRSPLLCLVQSSSNSYARSIPFRSPVPVLIFPDGPQKDEEATRQQGSLFFRENSSNGGKAIRTFWRNTKFGKIRCQGLNFAFLSRYVGVGYDVTSLLIALNVFALHSLLAG